MKKFMEPEIEIVKFTVEDVITTSNGGEVEPGVGGDDLGWG